MRYRILTEFDPLVLDRVSLNSYPRIHTNVYTDGEIGYETKEECKKIDKYYLGMIKYSKPVNSVSKKAIYLKNHSYAVTVTYSFEVQNRGGVIGWFCVPKQIKLYVANPNDVNSLKRIKETFKLIKEIHYDYYYKRDYGYRKPARCVKLHRIKTRHISDEVYKVSE